MRLASAIETINIPEELKADAETSGGFKLYVSGGGFRGLGHLLLARDVNGKDKYPLQIINGFSCNSTDIKDLFEEQAKVVRADRNWSQQKIFRVSEQATQLPAVTLLVSSALEVFPNIRKLLFSQGGVREGVLFHDLPKEIRVQDPLYIATKPYSPYYADKYI